MEISNIPIVEFYEHCLTAAKNDGFKWIVSLIARESDVDKLYYNLEKAWVSLDSITGKYFLFLFAGKENNTHEKRFESRIEDEFKSYVSVYNDYTSIINKNTQLHSYIRSGCEYERKEYISRLAENQTMAINSLKEYFSLSEANIPCLVFLSLKSNRKYIVPIQRNANYLYGYFKMLFNKLDFVLTEYQLTENRRLQLEKQKDCICENIKAISLSGEEYILKLYEELKLHANKTGNEELKKCIDERKYGKFEQPWRGKLSKYVDLSKNYEKQNQHIFEPMKFKEKHREKAYKKAKYEDNYSYITEQIYILNDKQRDMEETIEKIIEDSVVSERRTDEEKISININGNYAQVNTAFDNSSIYARQYNNADYDKLHELIDEIRKNISKEMTSDELEKINDSLEVIEKEILETKPKKSFLRTAISCLDAIKGTAEFGAAVATLVQFVEMTCGL